MFQGSVRRRILIVFQGPERYVCLSLYELPAYRLLGANTIVTPTLSNRLGKAIKIPDEVGIRTQPGQLLN